MSPERRQDCLFALKELGYQTGGGFMVGSPGQTPEHLAKDFLFLQKLQPQMVGIGPFLPHQDTPFRDCAPGAAEQTVRCVAILRLLLPGANLPATTALATLDPHGRQKAVLAGATNVILAHNHVSGLALPSDEDKQTTLYLRELLRQVGVILVDHLIFVDDDMVSMGDSGFLMEIL